MREQDKHFLWSLLIATGIILSWESLLSLIAKVPYVNDPRVGFFIGFAILTFTGVIFKQFDPLGGLEKSVEKVVKQISQHPQRKEYTFFYKDKNSKKEISFSASMIAEIEGKTLIVKNKRGEIFVPLHRISKIHHGDKLYWRL